MIIRDFGKAAIFVTLVTLLVARIASAGPLSDSLRLSSEQIRSLDSRSSGPRSLSQFENLDSPWNIDTVKIRQRPERIVVTDLDSEEINREDRTQGRDILKKHALRIVKGSSLASTYKAVNDASKKVEEGLSTTSKRGLKMSLGLLPSREPSPILKVGQNVKVVFNPFDTQLFLMYSQELH